MSEPTPGESSSDRASALQDEAEMLRKRAAELEEEVIRLQGPAEAEKAVKDVEARTGDVAVFLGAGASKTFGFPLTKELLPIILRRLEDDVLFEDERVNSKAFNVQDRALLRKTLLSLCPGLQLTETFIDNNAFRLPLVTSLLSMLDFSLSSCQSVVLGLTPEKIRDARGLLERSIYEAIEREKPEGQTYWSARGPNNMARTLASWVTNLRHRARVSVITSNYDVAIEKSWGFDNRDERLIESLYMDFGFDWTWPSDDYPEKIMRRPSGSRHRIYKLHGSTNWLRCGLCDRVYINPEVDIAVYAYDRKSAPANRCHCGHAKLEVQIVSPSFVRDMRAPNLSSVWQHALDSLRRAEDWIIIGYSFPDEDLNIRSLFTRALASRQEAPHLTVIQSGYNDQTRMRYEAFFPKRNFKFLTGGLETFMRTAMKGRISFLGSES